MRMARLELARQSHTHLKRARIPIPPHPQESQKSNLAYLTTFTQLNLEIEGAPNVSPY